MYESYQNEISIRIDALQKKNTIITKYKNKLAELSTEELQKMIYPYVFIYNFNNSCNIPNIFLDLINMYNDKKLQHNKFNVKLQKKLKKKRTISTREFELLRLAGLSQFNYKQYILTIGKFVETLDKFVTALQMEKYIKYIESKLKIDRSNHILVELSKRNIRMNTSKTVNISNINYQTKDQKILFNSGLKTPYYISECATEIPIDYTRKCVEYLQKNWSDIVKNTYYSIDDIDLLIDDEVVFFAHMHRVNKNVHLCDKHQHIELDVSIDAYVCGKDRYINVFYSGYDIVDCNDDPCDYDDDTCCYKKYVNVFIGYHILDYVGYDIDRTDCPCTTNDSYRIR